MWEWDFEIANFHVKSLKEMETHLAMDPMLSEPKKKTNIYIKLNFHVQTRNLDHQEATGKLTCTFALMGYEYHSKVTLFVCSVLLTKFIEPIYVVFIGK